jgi:hypothetical protein
MEMRHAKPTMKIPYGEPMMKTRFGILFSLVALALLGGVGIAAAAPANSAVTQAMDTIAPYNGPIGPGNSLYGLKIAFENLDESFTFNQSEKLEKQVSHADLRLAELKQELADNSTDTAEIALDQYWQKLNQTEETLAPFPPDDNGTLQAANNTGLSQAREMIAKHQQVLEDLLQSHPDNKGLARAYNNSIALEQKFTEKIETRHHNQQEAGNSTFMLPQNMTPPDTSGRFSKDGNQTIPQNWNGPAGNTTGNFPQGMNQTMDRNGQNPTGPATNQTDQGKVQHQQPGTGAPGNSQNQNNNGNTGNGQNSNNNVNPNNVNRNNNNNYGNAANGNQNQNNNNNGNAGAMTGGNTNRNTRFPGR